MTAVRIAPATAADVAVLVALSRALAEYEQLSDSVVVTEAAIHEALFGPHPAAEAVIARVGGEPAGFALWFHTFSTFLGRRSLYLEDLFVKPEWRGQGIGQRLLAEV